MWRDILPVKEIADHASQSNQKWMRSDGYTPIAEENKRPNYDCMADKKTNRNI